MPGGGLRDGEAELLGYDQGDAGPEGGAMEFAGGEEVVGGEDEHDGIGNQSGDQHVAVDEGEGPAADSGDEQRGGGNQNEALAELIGMGHPKSCERRGHAKT